MTRSLYDDPGVLAGTLQSSTSSIEAERTQQLENRSHEYDATLRMITIAAFVLGISNVGIRKAFGALDDVSGPRDDLKK